MYINENIVLKHNKFDNMYDWIIIQDDQQSK